ncbi:unnamed protein product [Closterium sp. NIES-53]
MASTAIPATLYRIPSSQHCRLQAQEAALCAQFARGQTSGSLRLPSRGAAAAGRGRTGSAISRRRLATVAATGTNVAADAEVDLYGLLGVDRSADKAELKRAFRKLALQYHPDVNSDPGAADTFIQLSNAYEVLVDEEQRALYDRFGVAALSRDFMAGRGGTERKGAAWEAFDTWDEFQPFQRKTRKGDARQAAAARWSSDSGSEGEGEAVRQVVEAVTGDVVEYPLSAAVRDRFHDGRIKGVGFVVGRNKGALLPCHTPCLCLFHPATHYFLSASIMVIHLVCTSPLLLAPSSASTSSSSASTSPSSASTFSSSASTSP